MQVTFLHPDLGIGGAERLIVDAALALQRKGHTVKVITNQFDAAHSFRECSELDIDVRFSWVPRSIGGRCCAAFAYLRMCLASLYLCFFLQQDVVVCDQISAALLVLKLFCSSRLVFYCHFPDLLLTQRNSMAKALYRKVVDKVEERSMAAADVICINSNFTGSIVRRTFPHLASRPLIVLYPSLNTHFFDECEGTIPAKLEAAEGPCDHIFTSINRFEAKKNIRLAVDAFLELGKLLKPKDFIRCRLVIAGGFDKRNEENIIVYRQLRDYVLDCGLSTKQYTFLQSPSDDEKVWLLRNSRAILYTPTGEHFGIVPVEAMYCGAPVLAVRSGGPMESVDDGVTGFLLDSAAEQFARAMYTLCTDLSVRERMTEEGPKRVKRFFSFGAFADKLDAVIKGEEVQ